jgi:hypothetical protein
MLVLIPDQAFSLALHFLGERGKEANPFLGSPLFLELPLLRTSKIVLD